MLLFAGIGRRLSGAALCRALVLLVVLLPFGCGRSSLSGLCRVLDLLGSRGRH